MNLPSKPTSGSWIRDAEALLEMGALSIDAATVRGLLNEIKERDSRIDLAFNHLEKAIFSKEDQVKYITLAFQELGDPDPWVDEPLTPEEEEAFRMAEKEEGEEW